MPTNNSKEIFMKKTALSLAVAALVLMSGCGDKKSESTSHETAAPAAKTESAVKPAAQKTEETAAAQTEEKKAETQAAEEKPAEAAAAAPAAAEEVATTAKEEAQKQVEKVTESVAKGEAEAKESVEKKVEEAKAQIDVTTLYTKCAGCHGMKGEKHALGKSNVIAGQSKEDLVKKIKGYQDGSYGGAMKAVMVGQVKGLSAEQIDALADHISKM